MKRKVIAVACALALGLTGTSQAFAGGSSYYADPEDIVVDVVLVRPICFVATILGSALFVVSLPVAATSKSVHATGEALVAKPAWATFTRPIGDMDFSDP